MMADDLSLPILDVPAMAIVTPVAAVIVAVLVAGTVMTVSGGPEAGRTGPILAIVSFIGCGLAVFLGLSFAPKGTVALQEGRVVVQRFLLPGADIALDGAAVSARTWRRGSGAYGVGIVLSVENGGDRARIGIESQAQHRAFDAAGAAPTSGMPMVRLSEASGEALLAGLDARGHAPVPVEGR